MLGYTQISWDNESGEEQLPWASIKFWSSLTRNEKQAARALGYTQATWDNMSGSEPQPAAGAKAWAELIACPDGKGIVILRPWRANIDFRSTFFFLLCAE